MSAVADGPARPSIRGKCPYVLGHPNFKARKLAHYGHTVRKQGSCLEKETIQGTMPGARRRGRLHTAWMDNIKMWTGLSAEESIRTTEDRDKWRKYIHGVANPRIEDG